MALITAPGTLVWLVSGGPAMTCDDDLRTDGLVCVQWFDGAELKRDAFNSRCLRNSDPTIPIPVQQAA